MKTTKYIWSLTLIICSLVAARTGAQLTTNTYVYNGNQAGSPGTNWSGTGVAAYWKLNGIGAAVQPFAGTATGAATNYNVFVLNSNGISLGSGTATTLV